MQAGDDREDRQTDTQETPPARESAGVGEGWESDRRTKTGC